MHFLKRRMYKECWEIHKNSTKTWVEYGGPKIHQNRFAWRFHRGSTEIRSRCHRVSGEILRRFRGRLWRGSLEVRHFLRHTPGTSSPEVPSAKENHARKGQSQIMRRNAEPLRVSPPRQDAKNPEPLKKLWRIYFRTSPEPLPGPLQTSFNIL